MFEKIVLVTRKTRLDGLVKRFNTGAQARFYIEHTGGDFGAYVEAHDAYQGSLEVARRAVETRLKVRVMERELVPSLNLHPGT